MAKMRVKTNSDNDGTTRTNIQTPLGGNGFTKLRRISLYGRAVFDGVAAILDVGLLMIAPVSAPAIGAVGFDVVRTFEDVVETSRDEDVLRG